MKALVSVDTYRMFRPTTPIAALTTVAVLSSLHLACACEAPPPAGGETLAPDRHRGESTFETLSLLGRPLMRPELPAERRGQLQADLDMARRAHEADPSSESAAITHGRRLAQLGRFREAISVCTQALATHPQSYRLLRHRGHRWITMREFDRAVADLSHAWALAKDRPDAPEPDVGGAGEPRSTDKSNILYHLGLAHYLSGDFNKAAEIFAERSTLAARGEPLSDDTLVAFLHWHYLSLRRAGREAEAARVLTEYRDGMDVRENAPYLALVRMYRGDVRPEALAPAASTTQSQNLAMAYGVGAFKLVTGERESAKKIFEQLGENENWPSFGVVAAESELARDQMVSVPTE